MLNCENLGTVLAVDGDFLSRRFIEKVLNRAGYAVLSACTPAEAKNLTREVGCGSLCCVLTDFSMPENGGADFLLWIGQEDSSIASITTSGSSDKALVEQSLRSGACNFLNKPLDRFSLEQAVFEASKLTTRKRRTAEIERDVEEVGAVQRLLISSSIASDSASVNLCFHPKHEAGGDFFSHLELPNGRAVALLTDVSGHELKSAFISAYFQGMVRAMLEADLPLIAIFERANLFLLNESSTTEDTVPVSICACAVSVDLNARRIEVLNCGAPGGAFVTATGDCVAMLNDASYPLGWFAEKQVDHDILPPVSGQLLLWTDGVEELAEKIGVATCAVAFALLRAKETGKKVPWLAQANDDVLVAAWKIQMPGDSGNELIWFRPIVSLSYGAEDLPGIDKIQLFIMNSLRVAVPEIGPETLHDVLLCARESLINALRHGCAGGGVAKLTLCLSPERQILTLIVEDEGPGHDFDCEEHASTATTQLTARHRGLILMRALSNRFKTERRGAKLTMDFNCKDI